MIHVGIDILKGNLDVVLIPPKEKWQSLPCTMQACDQINWSESWGLIDRPL
jgi:hypothetical protein